MDTIEPASISAELLERDDGTEPVQVVPPVVAVVVTNDPGPWLEPTLAALAAQDYPSLSVLVLDNCSAEDPTARVASAMPGALVRRRAGAPRTDGRNSDAESGFAAAANEAVATVGDAMFVLFCHDDIVLDADAVRVMVEEAYRSNAGIVGPKVVDHDQPDILLEVGMAVDHYAVPFSGIEPDEVDQEQHDGVRDVFFVSHTAMLVRNDLFHELSGFDPATFPGAGDIDLCWRARLAGARVIVAPAARIRHRRAPAREARRERDKAAGDLRAETRARLRVLCKSYSALALVWVLPAAFLLDGAEVIALLLTGRVRQARALAAGWLTLLAHPVDLFRARRATQRTRRVEDRDVRDLMIRGSARIRTFMTRHLHTAPRLVEVSTRARDRVNATAAAFRRLPALVAIAVGTLVLFGSRSLLFGRVPQVGSFRAWPGAGSAWSTFTAGWRTTMMGAGHAATPAFAFMALLTTALAGHAGLARSLVVGGALPLGAFGAYRLVRPFATSALPGVAAAVAYAANPIARNAIFQGELGPLVCFALTPFMIGAFVRAIDADATKRRRLHSAGTIALLGAVCGSVWPPAILLAVLIAIACCIAVPFVDDASAAAGAVVVGAAGAVGGALLLAPWSLSLIGADAATLGALPRPALTLTNALQFHTSRAGAGLAPWGILAAAVVPLAIARGPRLVWTVRAWSLAALSIALVWLPGRVAPTSAMLAPDGVLVGAAIGLAFAAGLGVAAVLDDLRRFHFGWRQVMIVVGVTGLAWSTLGLAADTLSGRFGLHGDDWASTYSWMNDNGAPGGFRVLWVGDPTVIPVDAKVDRGVGFATTRNGPGDARASWAAPEQRADRVLGNALRAAIGGSTARLGHLLAPAGVRYIAFVRRAAPRAGARGNDQGALGAALARQLDLTLSRVEDAGLVYENDAWIPMRALVPAEGASGVRVDDPNPLPAAQRSEPEGLQGVDAPNGRTAPIGPGTLLWSEAASSKWHASVTKPTGDTARAARRDAFGWTNAFQLDTNAPVRVSYSPGAMNTLARDFVLLLWAAVLAGWLATRHRAVVARRPIPSRGGDEVVDLT